jgi:hypothetical protein
VAGCRTCGIPLSRQNKKGYCRPHVSAAIAAERPKPEPRLCPCGAVLHSKNQSGLCLKHMLEQRNADPERIAIKVAALKRRFATDPELKEAQRRRARGLHLLPQSKEAKRRRWTPEFQRKGVEALKAMPEVRAAAVARMSATKLAWCPPHLRDDYRHLTQRMALPAAEARRMIEDQNEMELARWRRSIGVHVEADHVLVPEPAPVITKSRPQDQAFELATQLFDVTEDEILGPARHRRIMLARYALAVGFRQAGYSTTGVADALNRGDHNTAMNLLAKAPELAKRDRGFARKLERIVACWDVVEVAA